MRECYLKKGKKSVTFITLCGCLQRNSAEQNGTLIRKKANCDA